MSKSTCSSCHAPIIWCVTNTGKRMPLDAKPERRFVLSNGELGSNAAPLASSADTYVSHFATCPQSAEHRKPR